MKTLYVVRHAKAEEKSESDLDFDRELARRGKTDALQVGRVLSDRGVKPDLLISSAARRAISTARILARQLRIVESQVIERDDLYLADVKIFLKIINELNDSMNSAMIVSHNPGVTYFVDYLLEEGFSDFPTCGVATIVFEGESWRMISKHDGRLLFFDSPRKS